MTEMMIGTELFGKIRGEGFALNIPGLEFLSNVEKCVGKKSLKYFLVKCGKKEREGGEKYLNDHFSVHF